ncbi:CoA transferase [Xanthobacter autotrophicus DSM 431]|uniref:CaiB/BaiF CoA transferase family protein n=1 Tax=Xanthobacter nonsaccharivorans TaxID=3119912 RepID=UPI003729964D
MQTAKTDAKLPLAGIKVADFSRLLPGPWCTQMLADLGAEVIKVERPDGDPSRHNAPLYKQESVYFCSVNGGKRSLTLDLSDPAGQVEAHRLIAEADVLVESFGRGGAEKLEVHWERARTLNPRLVYCSITGFGQTGTLAPIAGHDLAIQAATGLLSLSDAPAPAFQAGDYAAASMAVIGILGGLRNRDRDGVGAYLDVAMFDALFGMGNIGLASALGRLAGGSGTPAMEVWGGNPRYTTYPTRDGRKIAVCLLEAKIWRRFCEAIGRPDLVFDEDPKARLSSHGDRSELFRQALSDYCLAHDRDEIGARMVALCLPVIPVLTPDEAVASEHVRSRGLVEAVDHPTEGRTFTLRSGLMGAGITRRSRAPAPRIGDAGPASHPISIRSASTAG